MLERASVVFAVEEVAPDRELIFARIAQTQIEMLREIFRWSGALSIVARGIRRRMLRGVSIFRKIFVMRSARRSSQPGLRCDPSYVFEGREGSGG